MNKFVSLIFGRFIIRVIGVNIRFIYFSLIGRKKLREELNPSIMEDNSNLDIVLKNDFLNAFVGAGFIIGLVLLVIFFS